MNHFMLFCNSFGLVMIAWCYFLFLAKYSQFLAFSVKMSSYKITNKADNAVVMFKVQDQLLCIFRFLTWKVYRLYVKYGQGYITR